MAMSGSRLVAGLAVLGVCVAVPAGGPARGQQKAGEPILPPPPSWSADFPAPPPAGMVPVSATVPERLPRGPETLPLGPPGPKGGAPAPMADAHFPEAALRPSAPPSNRQEPAVVLEWAGPSSIRLGQPAAYQLIVRNVSSGPVQQVLVRCPVPESVTVSVSDPLPLTRGALLTWELGTLAAGQERRINLQMVASSKAGVALGAVVSFTGMVALHVQVREPKLALKLAAPDRVVLGDSATVTLTVSNPGDGPAEHVKIKALLPEGLEHPRGRQFEVDLGALAPQEQRTLQLVCTARTQGPQRCEAAAAADGGLKAGAVAPVEVVLPRIDLAAAGPHLRYLERKAVYVFKATNPGSAPATNVTVQAVVPRGLKVQTATSGGQYDATAGTVSWFIGDLPPGQSREVSVGVLPVSPGEQRVRATVTAARGLRNEAEVVTRVDCLSALQLELADADDPVEVGADTAYEIRVTNAGSKMETNLQVTCTLPERMELRGARCAAGCHFRVEGRDVIFEALPRLAPKADVVYRVFVRGTAPGDLRCRARLRADGLGEPMVREESTKVYGDDAGAR
jgi:uncharacterized repeat protein (TIGR01451 family)